MVVSLIKAGALPCKDKRELLERYAQSLFELSLIHILTGTGANRSRRAYRIGVQGDTCTVHNGRTEMTMPFDLLMLAVRSLCGLEDGATPSLELVEETLRAANC